MDTTQAAKNGITKTAKKIKKVEHEVDAQVDNAETALLSRVESARDLVEDLRDRAELAIHERPYLVPVAAGALGLGVGVLIGSKLTRIVAFTAAGALLNSTIRNQLVKIGKDFINDLGVEDDDSAGSEDVEAVDDAEPSVT